ncbi:MAG: 3-deoxy-7-phosphoheptulonate synthase, partial [Beduini sp.]
MIIVLKPKTKQEDIERIEGMVKERGGQPQIVVGSEMTVIGIIGDTTKIDPRSLEVDEVVERVMKVSEPYKKANRAFHPDDSIIDVSGVKVG